SSRRRHTRSKRDWSSDVCSSDLSGFVGKLLENLISGSYTVSDENLFKMLALMYDSENIELEPSALAGVIGPLSVKSEGTHIAWSTGGDMVPEDIYKEYYRKGKDLL